MRGLGFVKSVTLHTAGSNGFGDIVATFYVEETPVIQRSRQGAIEVIQYITSLLDLEFEVTQKTVRSAGEQNKSWITVADEHEDTPYKVRLVHRSWSQNQVDAFQEIVRLLGWLHSWKINEEKH